MSDDLNFLMEDRRAKLAALEAAGIPPFAYRYDRTHAAAAAVAALPEAAADGERVSVAGRIVAWRAHGKTTFAHLADDSGIPNSSCMVVLGFFDGRIQLRRTPAERAISR